MWFRYFVTFIDLIIFLCIFFFMRGMNFEKDKISLVGFSVMLFSYAESIILMWR